MCNWSKRATKILILRIGRKITYNFIMQNFYLPSKILSCDINLSYCLLTHCGRCKFPSAGIKRAMLGSGLFGRKRKLNDYISSQRVYVCKSHLCRNKLSRFKPYVSILEPVEGHQLKLKCVEASQFQI